MSQQPYATNIYVNADITIYRHVNIRRKLLAERTAIGPKCGYRGERISRRMQKIEEKVGGN
jgi:hypothetical protein